MQTRRASKLALYLVAILALVGALAMLGCPSDDDEAPNVETASFTDVRVNLNLVSRAGAMGLRIFTFPRGFRGDLATDDPDRGSINITTTETTVTYIVAGAITATIEENDRTANVAVAYGLTADQPRCTFTVLDGSTFPANHPLGTVNTVINIVPCFYLVSANNVQFGIRPLPGQLPVGGAPALATMVLVFNTSESQVFGDDIINEILTAQLDFVGRLTVNGAPTARIITGSEGEGS